MLRSPVKFVIHILRLVISGQVLSISSHNLSPDLSYATKQIIICVHAEEKHKQINYSISAYPSVWNNDLQIYLFKYINKMQALS